MKQERIHYIDTIHAHTAVQTDESSVLSALYGQLCSIKKSMDAIAPNRENGKLSEKGKHGFKLTKQEIKTMPEHIRKIFIANNYIVNYRAQRTFE